jgi:thiopeptide-type bacteriocin biosynthesis protein
VETLTDTLSQPDGDLLPRLRTWAADPLVESALLVASESLHRRVADPADPSTPRERQRLRSGLLRYLTRMTTRPTPFGLFAGVAPATIGSRCEVVLGAVQPSATQTRVDMAVLLGVVRRLESRPEERGRMRLFPNALLHRVGERLVLSSADVYGTRDRRAVSLRATAPVEQALALAADGVAWDALLEQLCEAHPDAPAATVARMLEQLVEHGLLVSHLRPPLTAARPERDLAASLEDTAEGDGLRDAVARTSEADAEVGDERTQALHTLTARLRELAPTLDGSVIHVDAALEVQRCELPPAVADAAVAAAEVLARIGSHRYPAHLAEYHAAFVERYGPSAEVPLLELLSPEQGLGPPTGYLHPPRQHPLAAQSTTDTSDELTAVMAPPLARALHRGDTEIELDTQDIERIQAARGGTDRRPLPPSLDVTLQICAHSPEAVEAGDLRAVLAPFPVGPGGAMLGRFADMLGPTTTGALERLARQEEEHHPELAFAELRHLPHEGRLANVSVSPGMRRWEIAVNLPSRVGPDERIALADLVVGATADRLRVRSRRIAAEEVVVTQPHVLSPRTAPNACRFLLELSNARWHGVGPLSWGAASASPYLPRVVHRQIVLRPATWTLPPATASSTTDGGEAHAAIARWRAAWQVPRWVYLTDQDHRLLLDLDHRACVEELLRARTRSSAEDGERVTLEEMLPGFDDLWVRDESGRRYVAELVIPLRAVAPPRADDSPDGYGAGVDRQAVHAPVPMAQRRIWPGGEWTSLKLYADADAHDRLLTGPLRDLAARIEADGSGDALFFVRYADPAPHLRVRLHATDEGSAGALALLGIEWARELAAGGSIANVVVEPYDREVERYGGPRLIAAAERLFAADSALVLDLLAARAGRRLAADRLAVAVVTADRLAAAWGQSPAQRLALATRLSDRSAGGTEHRRLRAVLTELLHAAPTAANTDPPSDAAAILSAALARVSPTAQSTAAAFHAAQRSGEAWGGEQDLVASILHMHANRSGLDREQERTVYAMWRRVLQSSAARAGDQRTPATARG